MKTVLITDDSEYMRTVLRNILISAGFEIAGEAESGEEAVEKFKQLKPDLVTMDIVMSGKGGINALKKIIEINSSANVLMISAMGQQSLIVEAIREGAKGFTIKPFKSEDVIAEAKRIIE